MTSSLFCGAPHEVPVTAGSLMKELADTIVSAAAANYGCESQKETGHKLDGLASVPYEQQALRMQLRPGSLNDVAVAEGNRFVVDLDGLKRPYNKSAAESTLRRSSRQAARPATRRESAELAERLMALFARPEPEQSEAQLKELSAEPPTVCQPINPVAVQATGRNANTQSLTTHAVSTVASPAEQRISYSRLRTAPAANPESLRQLVQTKHERDKLRITAQVKALEVKSSKNGLLRAAKKIKTVYATLGQHSQALVGYFRRLKKLETELFTNSR